LSTPLVKSLLRLGVPLIPSFAFVFIILQGNKYILQWFGGLDAVGVYSIGFNIGMVMSLAVVAFTTAWSPYFLSFSDRHEEARVLFGRILTYYVCGFGALSLLFYIAAKPLVMLMTQPAFHDAYVVVGPSATAQVLVGAVSILLSPMFFAQEVKFITVIRAVAAIVSIVGNLLLIPAFGTIGAASGLVLGTLAMVVLQQAWNSTRRDYLAIVYQWNRVLSFGACYLLYAVVLLSNRSLALRDELVLSGIAAATLPVVLYLLLGPQDRLAFWRVGKQWVLRRRDALTVAART
jgi:O-antigen/teichoic acid export membrane protein